MRLPAPHPRSLHSTLSTPLHSSLFSLLSSLFTLHSSLFTLHSPLSTLLTIIIPTYNEAPNILAVLEGVRWADEIIVVDSFSTDGTVEMAKAAGATVLQRKYASSTDQKNWTIPQATHEWVLIVDADERVTPQLAAEIQGVLKNGPTFDAYQIRRQNYLLGKKIRFSGWQNDAVIRLLKRDRCRYHTVQVHGDIDTTNIQVGHLKEPLLHHTFRDMDHFMEKQRRYARWSAQDHLGKTPRITWFHLWVKPAFRFFKHYILKGGILDGREGFLISKLMAQGVRWRYEEMKKLKG